MTGALALTILAVGANAQTKSAPKAAPADHAKASAPARLYFIVAPTGNEARYRVREQLAGFDLPNDAVGATTEITGTIVVDTTGAIVRDSSKITVALGNLKSDKDRRDGFIKRRTLETEKYPTVELVPTMLKGLTARPSTSGPATFELMGDLTVRGVTHPTTWKVTARSEGSDVVGSATTSFTFKDFGMDQPRVPIVLSVADTIKLEYDFRFTPAPAPPKTP
jgi:polyisoprenoid-binding protein YceI